LWGVGLIGRLHAMGYWQNGKTELVGVIDQNPDLAKKVAAEFNTKVFSSLGDLIAAENPELISIAVPESVRFDLAIQAAKSGANLLLEKPLAPTLAEADKLVDEIEKISANKRLWLTLFFAAINGIQQLKTESKVATWVKFAHFLPDAEVPH
jgi:Predicted dehydrogenases and related proteins